jgi:1-acyl-sn-glycerol-3-phosphate acyltransferase
MITAERNHAAPDTGVIFRAILIVWGTIATVLAVFYTFVLGGLSALTANLWGGHTVSYLGRLWGWLIVRTAGIRVDIEGLEHLAGLKSFILVANHQSYFDIFATIAYIPGETRFVAKKELLKVPLIGYAMDHSGHILVDRQGGGRTIRKALDVMRRGYNVCVFAEGTRFSDGQVHKFNDGAAWLAILTKQPCVPMGISFGAQIYPRGARIVMPWGRMKIKLGAPIQTTGMRSADRVELTNRLEEAVRAMVQPSSEAND